MTHSPTEYGKQASTSHKVSQKNMLSKLQQGENNYEDECMIHSPTEYGK